MPRLPLTAWVGLPVILAVLQAPLWSEELPIRPVVQCSWEATGKASPDGALFATASRYGVQSVRLVTKDGQLAWNIPLFKFSDVAFSPDGKYMAACGGEHGFLLELASGPLQYFDAWRGACLAFFPDSSRVVIAVPQDYPGSLRPAAGNILFCNLQGQETARHALEMTVVQNIVFDAEGKTMTIHGLHGNPWMHVPMMGAAEQRYHLDREADAWEVILSPVRRDHVPRIETPAAKLPPCDPQRFPSFGTLPGWWDEANGFYLQHCSGFATLVWDIRHGRMERRLNHITQIAGLAQPGVVVGFLTQGRQKYVQWLDVRTGEGPRWDANPLALYPAPDGKHFAALLGTKELTAHDLEVRLLGQDKPVLEDHDAWGMHGALWSPDGRRLLRTGYDADIKSHQIFLYDVEKGKCEKFGPKEFLPETEQPLAGMWDIQNVTADEELARLAVALSHREQNVTPGGEPRTRVALWDTNARKLLATLETPRTYFLALRFVGADRLLTGGSHGKVQLWALPEQKPVWTSDTGARQIALIGLPRGSPYAVCMPDFDRPAVMDLATGHVAWRPEVFQGNAARRRPLGENWTNPLPIGDGRVALLEQTGTAELELVEMATGRALLTYAALPGSEWLVHVPDGHWDGSANVHEWVKFYRGLRLLTAEEAEGARSRERIDEALKAAFAPAK